MTRDFVIIGGKPLTVWVPETADEFRSGYAGLDPKEDEGMLFLIPNAEGPMWVPIGIGTESPILDVLWIANGKVEALATHMGGLLQAPGQMVIEVPGGWAVKNGVKLGTSVLWQAGNSGH